MAATKEANPGLFQILCEGYLKNEKNVARKERVKSIFGQVHDSSDTTYYIGNLGLIAGAVDWLMLEEIVNAFIGKTSNNFKIDNGALVKALVMQMLNVPYQSLYGTEEYFKNIPISALLQNSNISASDLNRHNLTRLLDDIHEAGPEKLFLAIAAKAVEKLGIKVESINMDSTSWHYDGESKLEPGCPIVLAQGYSRDHHEGLKQIITVGACESNSRVPVYTANVSGNQSDNKTFLNVIRDSQNLIMSTYPDLKYVVGDSALCTRPIIKQAKAVNLDIVTRPSDKYTVVKGIIADALAHPETLTPVYPNCLDSPKGKLCGEIDFFQEEPTEEGGEPTVHKMFMMVVSNHHFKDQKSKTINKRADKELSNVRVAVNKLATSPCKCQADAESAITKLQAKCKLCKITNIQYEVIETQARRGRPRKDGIEEKKVVGVKVFADVNRDENAIEIAIKEEMCYVIATTDIEREWTMADLHAIYRKQSSIERNWRACKDPKFMVDAIYLKLPSRINALMWLMQVALLVFVVTEYRLRQALVEDGLTLPSPDGAIEQERPTIQRFAQYIANCRISLDYNQMTGINVKNLELHLQFILSAMGVEWCKYYVNQTYEPYRYVIFDSR